MMNVHKLKLILIYMTTLTALSWPTVAAEVTELQALIDEAISTQQAELVISPGRYLQDATLRLEDVQNLKILAKDVTLVMTEFVPALALKQAQQVTVTGLTIDYDPLPFTQGTITAIDREKGILSFAIHDGYPDLDGEYAVNRLHVFDGKTREWKRGAPDIYGTCKVLSLRSGQLTTTGNIDAIMVGDLVCLNVRKCAGVILSKGTQDNCFEGVTILTAPGLGIMGRFGMGGDRFTVRIDRGPAPEGATEQRLMSTCADGLNYAYVRKGPILDGCDFAWMGDDSINFHSAAMPVYKWLDEKTLLTFRPHGGEGYPEVVKAGDPIRFLKHESFDILGFSTITSLKEVEIPEPPVQADVTTYFPVYRNRTEGQHRSTVYRISLAEPVAGIEEGDFFDLPSVGCASFEIKNCYFHDHRARGVRLMASQGKILNCRFERIKHAGLSIGPEYAYWREAGWVSEVTIKGNHFSDIGTGFHVSHASMAYAPAAISIIGPPASNPGSSHILIEENTVENCHLTILQEPTDHVPLTGNTILSSTMTDKP